MRRKADFYIQQVEELNLQIASLEDKINQIKPKHDVVGRIIWRYVKCGRKKCDCQLGKAYYHGPYPHLEWTEGGKVKTKYLNRHIYLEYSESLSLCKEREKLKAEKLKAEQKLKDRKEKLEKFI